MSTETARRSAGFGAALLLFALAGANGGCSLLFVNTAAPPKPRDCTTSRLAPILDTAMTGYQVVRTGYALGSGDEPYEAYGVSRNADIAVGASLTALFLGSAIYGYLKTAECSRVRAEFVDPANDVLQNEFGRVRLRAAAQAPRRGFAAHGIQAVEASCRNP